MNDRTVRGDYRNVPWNYHNIMFVVAAVMFHLASKMHREPTSLLLRYATAMGARNLVV